MSSVTLEVISSKILACLDKESYLNIRRRFDEEKFNNLVKPLRASFSEWTERVVLSVYISMSVKQFRRSKIFFLFS